MIVLNSKMNNSSRYLSAYKHLVNYSFYSTKGVYNINKIKGTNNIRSKVTIASAHSLAGYIFPKILGNLKNYQEKFFM